MSISKRNHGAPAASSNGSRRDQHAQRRRATPRSQREAAAWACALQLATMAQSGHRGGRV